MPKLPPITGFLPCNQDELASITHVYFGLHLLVSLLGDLEVSLLHIRTLLRVERVSDGAENKDVQLDSLLPLLLLFFVLGLKCSLYISELSLWRTSEGPIIGTIVRIICSIVRK